MSADQDGKAVALAVDCQLDLQEWAQDYRVIFPDRPFDNDLYLLVAMPNVFGAPEESRSRERLRVALRTSLWVFAADRIVDYTAKTRDEIDAVIRACMAVPDGTEPTARSADPAAELARCLADIHADLATAPGFEAHQGMWREQLQHYLEAMAQEWDWKTAGAHRTAPDAGGLTFETYLANADNFGSSLVNIGHWIFTGDQATLAHMQALWPVSQQVQRILRLLNDLSSYERDLKYGDLNSLMLDVDRTAVTDRITALIDECRELLRPLRDTCPTQADYLERQIGYSKGFYGLTDHNDYWHEL